MAEEDKNKINGKMDGVGEEHQDEQLKAQQESLNVEQEDPASKSLGDALKVSFAILKIIIVVIVVLFLVSGIFEVSEDERAIVLQFGKIRGKGDDRILKPGLQYAWPEPINEIIKIPVTKVLTVPIESFWYYQTAKEKMGEQGRVPETLVPTRDGYCLTRGEDIESMGGNDYNIVHSKWQLSYRIEDPEGFFRNMYYRSLGPGEELIDAIEDSVEPVIKSLFEDSVVTVMVNYSIEEAITAKADIGRDIRGLVQEKLDEIDSGITVVSVQATENITWPRQVDDAFENLIRARQNREQTEREAKGYAQKILSEVGGYEEVDEILAVLKDPEATEAEKQVQFNKLSGEAHQIIAEAKRYRTEVVEDAQANAKYLQALLEEYRRRPGLLVEKLYQDKVEEVLANVEEIITVESGAEGKSREVRVLINRNPEAGGTEETDKQEN
jgi:membrane protease subunit HflK